MSVRVPSQWRAVKNTAARRPEPMHFADPLAPGCTGTPEIPVQMPSAPFELVQLTTKQRATARLLVRFYNFILELKASLPPRLSRHRHVADSARLAGFLASGPSADSLSSRCWSTHSVKSRSWTPQSRARPGRAARHRATARPRSSHAALLCAQQRASAWWSRLSSAPARSPALPSSYLLPAPRCSAPPSCARALPSSRRSRCSASRCSRRTASSRSPHQSGRPSAASSDRPCADPSHTEPFHVPSGEDLVYFPCREGVVYVPYREDIVYVPYKDIVYVLSGSEPSAQALERPRAAS